MHFSGRQQQRQRQYASHGAAAGAEPSMDYSGHDPDKLNSIIGRKYSRQRSFSMDSSGHDPVKLNEIIGKYRANHTASAAELSGHFRRSMGSSDHDPVKLNEINGKYRANDTASAAELSGHSHYYKYKGHARGPVGRGMGAEMDYSGHDPSKLNEIIGTCTKYHHGRHHRGQNGPVQEGPDMDYSGHDVNKLNSIIGAKLGGVVVRDPFAPQPGLEVIASGCGGAGLLYGHDKHPYVMDDLDSSGRGGAGTRDRVSSPFSRSSTAQDAQSDASSAASPSADEHRRLALLSATIAFTAIKGTCSLQDAADITHHAATLIESKVRVETARTNGSTPEVVASEAEVDSAPRPAQAARIVTPLEAPQGMLGLPASALERVFYNSDPPSCGAFSATSTEANGAYQKMKVGLISAHLQRATGLSLATHLRRKN
mmetsp:Transcript_28497/g.66184  ORF Transcript_28497/g.66184 Transcript_28497/m.66184 type:complete len:427 (-) Transcript_28497:112-1392(-)